MYRSCLFLIVLSAVTAIAATSHANAVNATTEPHASVDVLGGYGVSLVSMKPSPFEWTLAGRAGYTWTRRVFTGATVLHHFGGVEDAVETQETKPAKAGMLQLGGELGFDAPAAPRLVLRPYLGLGASRTSVRVPFGASAVAIDYWDPYVSAGSALLFDVTQVVHVGADLRFSWIFADDGLSPDPLKAFVLCATAGARF